MLATLRKEVGTACKCLTLEDWERPSKQEEEPEGLTYAVSKDCRDLGRVSIFTVV